MGQHQLASDITAEVEITLASTGLIPLGPGSVCSVGIALCETTRGRSPQSSASCAQPAVGPDRACRQASRKGDNQ
jgi:hypothetical protein